MLFLANERVRCGIKISVTNVLRYTTSAIIPFIGLTKIFCTSLLHVRRKMGGNPFQLQVLYFSNLHLREQQLHSCYITTSLTKRYRPESPSNLIRKHFEHRVTFRELSVIIGCGRITSASSVGFLRQNCQFFRNDANVLVFPNVMLCFLI